MIQSLLRSMEILEILKENSHKYSIAELAENYDLVVMGTAGRTGIRKMLMGSVTQYVIANTECPVMAVKIKE